MTVFIAGKGNKILGVIGLLILTKGLQYEALLTFVNFLNRL